MGLALAALLLAAPAPAQTPDLASAHAAARADAAAAKKAALAAEFPDEDYPGAESEDADVAPRGFRLVSPGLYRSAQPARGNYPWLARFGIKTLLDLRDPVSGELERWEAGKSGLEVKNVPMSGLREPSYEQVDRALDVLTDPSLPRPLLVHCYHGQDRTGLVVAAYRVVVEGVPPSDAAREARGGGCCHTVTGDLEGFLVRYRRHRAAPRTRARP